MSIEISPSTTPEILSNEPMNVNEDIDLKDTDGDEGELSETSGTMRSQWSASDMDSDEETSPLSAADLEAGVLDDKSNDKMDLKRGMMDQESEEDDVDLDTIDDILALPEEQFPRFTLAKNKARFLRMVSWYKNKKEWLEVAPLSGVSKLFKQQTKELVGIRASKLDYEMELETGTLTPSQRSYRRDELKMCKVHEKMAVNLIARMQVKIKSGRR